MEQKRLRKLMRKYAIQHCCVELKDVMLDRMMKFEGYTAILPAQPKRKYTCYQCWEKFFYTHELTKHKLIHKKEEEKKQKQLEAERQKEKEEARKRKEEQKQKEAEKGNRSVANDNNEANLKEGVSENNANSPYTCEICKVGLHTIDEVKKHATNSCKFHCDKCKRTYNTMHGFNIHILQHKINSVKPKVGPNYPCPDCSKTFMDMIQLRSHTLLNHTKKTQNEEICSSTKISEVSDTQNEQQDLTCELCFDVFTNYKDYNEHVDFHKLLTNTQSPGDHLGTENNEVIVPVIESSYSLAEPLESEDVKNKSKYKKSKECFPITDDLESGGFEIVKPNDIIPQDHYKCRRCFRMYMSMDEYNNHLVEHCTIIKNCTECSNQVKGNVHFFNHFSKIHSKIFICEYCFEVVKGYGEVEKHRLSHLKLFKNVCKICYRIFKNYPAFNKHLNDHLKF